MFSLAGIKSGLLNIPVIQDAQKYLGIAIQDVQFIWKQIAMDLSGVLLTLSIS